MLGLVGSFALSLGYRHAGGERLAEGGVAGMILATAAGFCWGMGTVFGWLGYLLSRGE